MISVAFVHCLSIFHSMTMDKNIFSNLQVLRRCQDDLKKVHSDLDRQKAEMVKKEEELKSVTRTNEEREKKLQMQIDGLKEQSKKDKEELVKALEKTLQVCE